MIDKEKMVEEIEKILQLEQIKIANTTEEFAKLQKDGINRCNAEALYNAGCLKVSEDMVVLTKEEWADTQARVAYLQEELGKLLKGDNILISAREYGQLLYANENARKETAKEFAQELIKHFEEQKKRYDMCIDQRRKDLLKLSENEQELREYTIRCEGKENGQWVAADKSVEYINKLLKEKYGVEVEE